MSLGYVWPVAFRIVGFTALSIALHSLFGVGKLSTEAILILAFGFTVLDRQQSWARKH